MSSSSHSKSPSGSSFRWPFGSSKTSSKTPSSPTPPPADGATPLTPPKPATEEKKEPEDGKPDESPKKDGSEVQDGSDPQPDGQTASAQTSPLIDNADPDAKLDIVFVQDTTASQSPYITAAKQAISTICDKLKTKTNMLPSNLRFGLIAFRDHPPQDRTYVTKEFGFTSDMEVMEEQLKGLRAQGGGDGPEAVTAALAGALNMPWDEKAAKMVVLITDAPPHGIGEANDGFDASPDQNDPLELARQMAEQGITLFMVACEPTLSRSYVNAVDFYAALTEITGGKMLPLTMADKLGDYIAGNAVETLETEKLIKQYKDKIVDNVYGQGKALEDVVAEMQKDLDAKNVHINSYEAPAAYVSTAASEANKMAWTQAKKIGVAKSKVTRISGSRYAGADVPEETPVLSSYAVPPSVPGSVWTPSTPSMEPERRRSRGFFGSLRSSSAAPPPPPPTSVPAPGGAPLPPSPAAMPMGYAAGVDYHAALAPPAPASVLVPSEGSPSGYSMPAPRSSSSTSSEALYSKKKIDLSQTKRVVMQSMARSSKVTEAGMTKKAED